MIRTVLSTLALLLAAAGANAQSIKLPPEIKGQPGLPVLVVPEVDGGNVVWFQPDPGLVLIDSTFFGGTSKNVIAFGPAGRYRLWAAVAKADKIVKAETLVIIGDAPPVPPGPGPGPGPGPTPVPPDPQPPAPIAEPGLHVLIVHETEDKLTPKQKAIVTSTTLRGYLDGACAKDKDGPGYRIWDKDQQDVSGDLPHWQAAMKRTAGKPTPWIIISNGKTGFEGPLPGSLDEVMLKIKNWEVR